MKWYILITPSGVDTNVYSEKAKAIKDSELFEKADNELTQRLAVLKKLYYMSDYEIDHIHEDHPGFHAEIVELFPESHEFSSDKGKIEKLIQMYEELRTEIRVFKRSTGWTWKEAKLIR